MPPPFQLAASLSNQLLLSFVPGDAAPIALPVRAADAAMMFCTSRQPRLGLASSISATTPETIGVESDVPLKPSGGLATLTAAST